MKKHAGAGLALTFLAALFLSPAAQADWEKNIAAGEKAYQEGQRKDAEKFFLAALEDAEKLKPDDPKLATTLNDLAVLYDEAKLYTKAEGLYKRVVAIRERTLGPDHPDLATALNNMGNVYKDESKFDLAEPLYKKAIAIYTKANKLDLLSLTYCNLGSLYELEKKPMEALNCYKTALPQAEKVKEGDNLVIDVVNHLADTYEKLGKPAEAKPYYERYIKAIERAISVAPTAPDLIPQLQAFARSMKRNGMPEDAARLEKAMTIVFPLQAPAN